MSSALPNVASEERTIRSIQSRIVTPGTPLPVVPRPTLLTLQVTLIRSPAKERPVVGPVRTTFDVARSAAGVFDESRLMPAELFVSPVPPVLDSNTRLVESVATLMRRVPTPDEPLG